MLKVVSMKQGKQTHNCKLQAVLLMTLMSSHLQVKNTALISSQLQSPTTAAAAAATITVNKLLVLHCNFVKA